MSAGLTPPTLLACPIVSGLTWIYNSSQHETIKLQINHIHSTQKYFNSPLKVFHALHGIVLSSNSNPNPLEVVYVVDGPSIKN